MYLVFNFNQNEMSSLKEDNIRLNKILSKDGTLCTSSVPTTPCCNSDPLDKRLSLGDPTKFGKWDISHKL